MTREIWDHQEKRVSKERKAKPDLSGHLDLREVAENLVQLVHLAKRDLREKWDVLEERVKMVQLDYRDLLGQRVRKECQVHPA